jgi:D-xylose transport system permease protein
MTTVAPPSATPYHPDEEDESFGGIVRGYVTKVRGGDVGSLPAVLGLVVLVLVFTALEPKNFTNAFNVANLVNQSSAVMVIAMGLVFVLLLGEIDLSAGFTAGTGACAMCIFVTRQDFPWLPSIILGLLTGAVIGAVIGTLVSRLGIPSFVVTLAAFLALQGLMLVLIGEGGTIPVRNETILAIANKNLPVWLSWALAILGVVAYAAITLRTSRARRAAGLKGDPMILWALKAGSLALIAIAATVYLTAERSKNPALTSLKGFPIVILVLLTLLVGLTFILSRTAWGRHVYAVGGNEEAARRAGINVGRIKLTCFILCSTMAAVGGILLASRNNSVSPNTGGELTLLYAVGAAVIGGTSLFGGKGRILDAVIGGLVVAVIDNGMGLLNQPQGRVYMVTGAILLVAASVDAISRRKAAASGRL